MSRTVAIVQARMGSSRLPGKVLRPIQGRPMFAYQLERLRRARRIDHIVVATTTEPADDAIVTFCAEHGVDCVRGSEADVLSRYHLAAEASSATTVVRVTSDCPLLDPGLVDRAVAHFFEGDGCDYLSNMLPPTWPYGMAVEVMTRAALDEAHREATVADEREHVTPFLYRRPERYRVRGVESPRDLSHHRWTVDTPEDFELVSKILDALYATQPQFTIDDVLTLLDRHPQWADVNRHVAQKSVSSIRKETSMSFKTEQEAFWAGQFGADYIARNEGSQLLASNLTFFSRALQQAGKVGSAIEFGANIGMNLRALKLLYPDVDLQGIEINPQAQDQLATLIGEDKVFRGSILDYAPKAPVDLALIKGVLIHLNPEILPSTYRKLYEASRRWILVCEYYNPSPVAIPYRGHTDRLFKRDFAGEMLDTFPDLKLVDYGFAYRRDPAFPQDDITWFLMRKDA